MSPDDLTPEFAARKNGLPIAGFTPADPALERIPDHLGNINAACAAALERRGIRHKFMRRAPAKRNGGNE